MMLKLPVMLKRRTVLQRAETTAGSSKDVLKLKSRVDYIRNEKLRKLTEKRRSAGDGKLIMKEIRTLGYIPKFRSAHNVPAKKYYAAVQSHKLSLEQIEEAEALTAAHTNPLHEAYAPSDPLAAFAERAASRLEQDLLMASNGLHTEK